jgi:hypothetical protein
MPLARSGWITVAIGCMLLSGCNERREERAAGSVTVRLPPAQPAAPRPGFHTE